MMKATSEEIKQSSSIHQRIRNASFVPSESHDTENFKYNLRFRISKYIHNKFIALKSPFIKIIQKVQLWASEIDFKKIRNDVSAWLVEAFIEGFTINFIVWALIDWRFNLVTMMGWGFAIKYILGIYWRLRKDGSNSTIPKKDK